MSRRTANKKLTITKVLTKTTNCTSRARKLEGHNSTIFFRHFILDVYTCLCTPFPIMSSEAFRQLCLVNFFLRRVQSQTEIFITSPRLVLDCVHGPKLQGAWV